MRTCSPTQSPWGTRSDGPVLLVPRDGGEQRVEEKLVLDDLLADLADP